MVSRETSRDRYQQFVERFRRRDFDERSEDDATNGKPGGDDSDTTDSSSVDKAPRRARRRNYLRMYGRQLRPHTAGLAVLVICSLLTAGLEVIQPLFMRYIIDQVLLSPLSTADKLRSLHLVGGVFLGTVVISQILGLWKNYQQHLLNVRVILSIRRALFDRLLKLPLEKLSEMKTGGIISRLTDDVNTTTGLFQMAIVSPGVAVVRLLLAITILFSLNWQLALTAIAIIPFVMVISLIAARRIRPIYRQVRRDVSDVDGRVGEAFEGIRAVRAFLGERRENHAYAIGHHTITRMKTFARRRELILWGSWSFLMAAISLVIVWVGGFLQIQGNATVGDIMAFQWYTFLLLNPVWQIVESFSELQRSLAAMERVFEVLEMPEDKPDVPGAITAPVDVQSIELRDVWFSYNGEDDVLRDINLQIAGGTVVALVGRSGSGKTTMTDLIGRFSDPTKGQILLNGTDVKNLKLASFRQILGIVQQEVFLFDGTVRDNVAYANRNASIDAIIDAASRANAHEFITELPNGYDTTIGERGVKLSGGQRQRLSIARALLADPKILILDEATSNLDTESEQLIQQSMSELLRDRTTIMIAHRLSTIAHADQIVVMEQGQIVETGTHQELLQQNGLYAEMVHRQRGTLLPE